MVARMDKKRTADGDEIEIEVPVQRRHVELEPPLGYVEKVMLGPWDH